ncbi:MAG: nucleotidyltransferase family protein [Draconibacterium sp.]|nr:nucleotidyltransferase family protein [Draconibacterium sp.]
MKHKDLFYFTSRCLTLDKHPYFRETIISRFSSGEVNLDDFIFLCSNQLVLPAIYLHFKKHNLLDIFPVDYREHIAAIYLHNKKRNLDILRQIDEINLKLSDKNITPIYLKGTANLLDNVYSNVGERMIGDIDLLAQEKDYLKSAELIMQLGYKTNGKAYYDLTKAKHYLRLYRSDVPADIEIHRIPVNIEYSKQFNSELIFQNKKQIADKVNYFVPSDEHKAIHNFIHAQLSNLGYGFKQTPLRDLYDMYLLSKRIETTSLIRQAEEKRKITTYLIFTMHIFGIGTILEIKENRASRLYIKIHDWFLNHPKIHRWHILSIKLFEVLFIRFFRGVRNIFITKSWGSFFKQITDPGWYKMIIYRVRNFYGNYISRK